jgi:DNA repair protein RecO (recombination protein O)
MHKLFVSDGLVLQKRGAGEANTLVALFTEELGLVRASARSARVERSKLRYGLETLTRARFSMVRGKYEWKLTGVQNVSHEFIAREHSMGAERRQIFGRVMRLLLRLIHGEEPVSELYRTVVNGFSFLLTTETAAEAEAIECVLVLRILASLGYLPDTAALAPFTDSDVFSADLAARAIASRLLLIRAINDSLSATGL